MVADGLFLALDNERIKQRGHGLVILRIDRRLIDDQLAHVVLDGLRHGFLAFANALGQRVDGADAALDDQRNQRHIVKGRDLLAILGTDIGVDQKAHVRLVGLQVDVVTTGELHLVTHFGKVIDLGLDFGNFLGAIARLFQFVCKVTEAADQRRRHLVQVQALGFVGLELLGVTRILAAEKANVGRCVLGLFNRLAQGFDCLAGIFEIFLCLAQAVSQDTGHVRLVVAVQGAAGVVANGAFQQLEQVLVVDDVTVLLILTVQAVDPADGLEQAVVAHLFVDVEVSGRRRVEAGQQLVHYN
ncbi:hypothetical protein D3C77_272180 [compost metagenome]